VTHSTRPALLIAATPTPNGDLHIGHLAGPYLAGDVHARYLRAAGRPVLYATCTDDSQSYVVSTAHRRDMTPAALCAASTAAIEGSLADMAISMPGLPPIDDGYRAAVLDFVTTLHRAGRFGLRTVRLPFALRAQRYLFDGLVSGTCPVCASESCGGACEQCGHPNNFDDLLDARSTTDPHDTVVYREATILVLALEDYREQLTAYFAERAGTWRPHATQLIAQLLDRPLPEVPVTIPGDWGIPAPFAETPGQVLYPWIEAMPASMYSTWWAARRAGAPDEAYDARWRAETGAELVYFHGFDNVYHWGLLDLVLLMAHGDRYVLPAANVCNEFYDLDGEKFSTSRNHLIWARDLLADVPRDLVRFYLALTAPERERTNFNREALRSVTQRRLVDPWNRLARLVEAVDPASPLATTAAARERCDALVARIRACYELPGYSISAAAEVIARELERLAGAAAPPPAGDLLLEARTLLACAAPLLVDVADAACRAGAELALSAAPPAQMSAFTLPPLPAAATPRAALAA
jgi:methionyl-tRNA synthetase